MFGGGGHAERDELGALDAGEFAGSGLVVAGAVGVGERDALGGDFFRDGCGLGTGRERERENEGEGEDKGEDQDDKEKDGDDNEDTAADDDVGTHLC